MPWNIAENVTYMSNFSRAKVERDHEEVKHNEIQHHFEATLGEPKIIPTYDLALNTGQERITQTLTHFHTFEFKEAGQNCREHIDKNLFL